MKTRYSKLKSTDRLLESQNGGDESNPQHLQDLIDNAVSSGHSKEDIEVGYEDDAVVQGWLAEQAEADKTYSDRRATAYASIPDQLDYIYHNGVDAWKADMILPIKNKYPKENE
jgi:hypothetical protein